MRNGSDSMVQECMKKFTCLYKVVTSIEVVLHLNTVG